MEQAVDRVPGVRTGCAAAASHHREGASTEVLFLFVEHAHEASDTERKNLPEACMEAVLQATGLNVDELVVLKPGTLPRTSSGKIRRREALRRHLNQSLHPPKVVGTLQLLGTMLRSHRAMSRSRR